MNKVAGIKLIKGDSPTKPWEVHVAKKVFGKRDRKRFGTKEKAETHLLKLSRRAVNKERTPLDPELHKIVALFADKLSIPQIQTMLEEGVQRYSVVAKALSRLVEEYLEHQQTLFEQELFHCLPLGEGRWWGKGALLDSQHGEDAVCMPSEACSVPHGRHHLKKQDGVCRQKQKRRGCQMLERRDHVGTSARARGHARTHAHGHTWSPL